MRLKTGLATLALMGAVAAPALAQERIAPSLSNPAVSDNGNFNIVYPGGPAQAGAPLVIFLPGTGGRSEFAPRDLLNTIAGLGYRVVYLTYDDRPAVNQLCPRLPAPCAGRFRQSRVFGGYGNSFISTPGPEGIVPRLTDLLRYLNARYPQQGWNAYLDAQGRPVWPRIVVSGLSQGAGMAAFIAKRFPVDRVVLFSSPWDFTGPDRRPSPWLYEPSATPPSRWWAERHVRENTTQLIAHAYAVLGIPRDHILLFDGGLPPDAHGENPYHGSTVDLAQYAPQWRVLYGAGAATALPSAP